MNFYMFQITKDIIAFLQEKKILLFHPIIFSVKCHLAGIPFRSIQVFLLITLYIFLPLIGARSWLVFFFYYSSFIA